MNLNFLRKNLQILKARTKAKVCAVVKSDAYGHGLETVSRFLADDADELAVATFEEANRLCKLGLRLPVNILGCPDKSVLSDYPTNVFPCVATNEDADYLAACGFRGAVNIAVNSGMNRIGCLPQNIDGLYARIQSYGIAVKSFFTHFYRSGDLIASEKQFIVFDGVRKKYAGEVPQFHCCASNFLTLPEETHLDMVRTGIALYGYGYSALLPCMTVVTSVLQIFSVKKGEQIGYGTFYAPNNCTVAAIRAGYGDGYRRRLDASSRYVSVKGVLCPVLGQICMDISMVDVSGLDVTVGDSVYLLGGGVSCEALAASYRSIDYEVLTSFTPRAERKYVGQSAISGGIIPQKVEHFLQGRER